MDIPVLRDQFSHHSRQELGAQLQPAGRFVGISPQAERLELLLGRMFHRRIAQDQPARLLEVNASLRGRIVHPLAVVLEPKLGRQQILPPAAVRFANPQTEPGRRADLLIAQFGRQIHRRHGRNTQETFKQFVRLPNRRPDFLLPPQQRNPTERVMVVQAGRPVRPEDPAALRQHHRRCQVLPLPVPP